MNEIVSLGAGFRIGLRAFLALVAFPCFVSAPVRTELPLDRICGAGFSCQQCLQNPENLIFLVQLTLCHSGFHRALVSVLGPLSQLLSIWSIGSW